MGLTVYGFFGLRGLGLWVEGLWGFGLRVLETKSNEVLRLEAFVIRRRGFGAPSEYRYRVRNPIYTAKQSFRCLGN